MLETVVLRLFIFIFLGNYFYRWLLLKGKCFFPITVSPASHQSYHPDVNRPQQREGQSRTHNITGAVRSRLEKRHRNKVPPTRQHHAPSDIPKRRRYWSLGLTGCVGGLDHLTSLACLFCLWGPGRLT